MKRKARDIVAGWPRGRSTLSSYRDVRAYVTWPLIGWPALGRFAESVHIAEEAEANHRYHEEQQRMVDKWLRNSLSDSTRQHFLRFADIAREYELLYGKLMDLYKEMLG